MKVYEILNREPLFSGCKFGIEVEVEGKKLPKEVSYEWKTTVDGSLRGEAYEYILNNPLTLVTSKKAIKNLIGSLEENQSVLNFSCRTSVHVHMNIMDLELQKLANILYLYYIFEDVLLKYSGEDRYENRFCLSVRNAEYILQDISQYFNDKYLDSFDEGKHKYASLNLAAIPNKGSIEFRSMRGTLATEILFPWLDVLSSLYKVGCEFKSMKDIASFVYANGVNALASKLFNKHLHLFFKEGMENEVYYNMSICAELPELSINIKVQDKKKVNPFEVKNVFDEMDQIEDQPEEEE